MAYGTYKHALRLGITNIPLHTLHSHTWIRLNPCTATTIYSAACGEYTYQNKRFDSRKWPFKTSGVSRVCARIENKCRKFRPKTIVAQDR